MRESDRKVASFLFLALFACLIPARSFAQYQVGQKVQNFTLKDLDGNSVSLYDFAGKVIVLNFFATW